jgi:hypothetical protein
MAEEGSGLSSMNRKGHIEQLPDVTVVMGDPDRVT